MYQWKKFLFCFIAMQFFVACSSMNVTQTYDKQVNFHQYKTFRWKTAPLSKDGRADIRMQQIDQYIRQAVNQEMAALGYVYQDSSASDVIVDYQLDMTETAQEIDINDPQHAAVNDARITGEVNQAYGPSWSWNRGERPQYEGWQGRKPDVIYYEKSKVIVLMYESSSKHLIWQGSANKVINMRVEPDRMQKTVDYGIGKIFQRFPKK